MVTPWEARRHQTGSAHPPASKHIPSLPGTLGSGGVRSQLGVRKKEGPGWILGLLMDGVAGHTMSFIRLGGQIGVLACCPGLLTTAASGPRPLGTWAWRRVAGPALSEEASFPLWSPGHLRRADDGGKILKRDFFALSHNTRWRFLLYGQSSRKKPACRLTTCGRLNVKDNARLALIVFLRQGQKLAPGGKLL